jgi:quercetin dioxygenase-like cupin family protein
MNPPPRPAHGEVLKLGAPAAGEAVVVVDPAVGGAAFAAGMWTLRPGAQVPLQRHLDRDAAWFVHKGQGRATLDGKTTIVNPGAAWAAPRGSWCGVRNIGNGDLQLMWVASAGFESYVRDLAHLGPSASAEALEDAAGRHRVQLQPVGTAAAPAAEARSGRRRGRRRRGRGTAPAAAPAAPAPVAAAPAAPASPQAAAVAGAGQGRRRRRRRGGRGRRGRGQQAQPQAAPPGRQPSGGAPAAAAPSGQRAPRPASRAGRQDGGRRRGRFGRAKEVYMGGQWVRVEGEKPVIAPGRDAAGPRGRKPGDDDDSPGGPLSVPL